MTEKCNKARKNILMLCKEHLCKQNNDSYRKYIRATLDFKERFKKKFDPLNMIDDYLPDYQIIKLYQIENIKTMEL